MVRDKPLCSSWEKKMEAKREKELVKQYTLKLKEDKAREKEVQLCEDLTPVMFKYLHLFSLMLFFRAL